jgi:hypothetical protein
MEECFSPIMDLIIIDKSAPFVRLIPSNEMINTNPQLMSENHLLDLLEEGKINKEKTKNIFSYKIKAIDTKFLKENKDDLSSFK